MSDTRCIAVLNYKRPVGNIDWFLKMYDKYDELEVNDTVLLLASGNRGISCDTFIDVTNMTVAQSRNAIIQYCVDKNIKHLHMIDDDISIEYHDMFYNYESLSEMLNIPYINNGYSTARNFTMDTPNPRIRCSLGKYKSTEATESIIFNAFITNGYSYYNIDQIGDIRYDENMLCLEEDEYVCRLVKSGNLPFFNFFVDIDESWDYIKRIDNKSVRVINADLINKDREYMKSIGAKWEMFNNVDMVIEYIEKQIG